MQGRFIHTVLMLAATWLLAACTIEPPLHLAPDPQDVTVDAPIVITDLEVIWDVDADWRSEWYYGWDETDERLWGKLEYPTPTNYEVRRYYTGTEPGGKFKAYDGFTIYGNTFRRKYQIGYYDMLLWSNIDSDDGTQTVIIDETDRANIFATTSKTRVGYANGRERTRVVNTHNQPEIFYSGRVGEFYISPNIEDYDYYDEVEHVWVKHMHAELTPVVYIYLVQVVLHNNNGRVTDTGDQATVSGLADGVSLHTGITSQVDANITLDMRLKKDRDVLGETCDVIGGKLTTYGLCSMEPWRVTRGPYEVTRLDLDNQLAVCLRYNNAQESVLTFDVTDQMRAHPHGGVITIHLDVDDIEIPVNPEGNASGFDPTVEDYDHVEYELGI